MNKLEGSLLRGAAAAQKQYASMTGGWWLDHGPESFFQIVVAQHVAKLGHAVYVDATFKKLKDGVLRPGRPSKDLRKRPDISVWNKSNNSLRAAIELKRAWSFAPVASDAEKLIRFLHSKSAPKCAYLLVYSDAQGNRGIETLNDRFSTWALQLSWSSVGTTLKTVAEWDAAWGVALFRYDS